MARHRPVELPETAERAAESITEIPEAAATIDLVDEVVSFDHGVDREPGR